MIITSFWEAADESGPIFSPNWVTTAPCSNWGLSSNNNHSTTTTATAAGPELTEKDEDEGSRSGGFMIDPALSALAYCWDSGFQEELAAWAARAGDAGPYQGFYLNPENLFQNSSFLIRIRMAPKQDN